MPNPSPGQVFDLADRIARVSGRVFSREEFDALSKAVEAALTAGAASGTIEEVFQEGGAAAVEKLAKTGSVAEETPERRAGNIYAEFFGRSPFARGRVREGVAALAKMIEDNPGLTDDDLRGIVRSFNPEARTREEEAVETEAEKRAIALAVPGGGGQVAPAPAVDGFPPESLEAIATKEQIRAQFPSLTDAEVERIFRDQFDLDKEAPRGFAPQAKQIGFLPSGRPFEYDPNAPLGQRITDPNTGKVLAGADFDPVDEFVNFFDETTGNTVRINTATGDETILGQFGHAVTSPEDQRRLDAEIATTLAEREGTFQTQAEAATLQQRLIAEQEANRRAQLQAGVSGFQTTANLAPQLGQFGLNAAEFARSTFSTPAHFGFAAAQQRGEIPNFSEVTQADLINQLTGNIQGFNQALAGFNTAPITGFNPTPVAPVAAPQVAPQAAPAPATTPPFFGFVPGGGGFASGSEALDVALQQANRPRAAGELDAGAELRQLQGVIDAQRAAGNLPQARGGGFFNEPVEVHDDEIVTAVPGGGFFVQPKGKTKPKQSAQEGGFFGDFSQFFDIPQLPTFPPITQEQIQGFATEFAPPAVRDVFRGQRPAPLRFSNIPGFQLPTPRLLGSLTPREREATAGFLAPFGHTPGDVEAAITQRFLPSRQRPRATLQAGF